MFKRRAFVLFVLAVGLGVGATWQANRWIQSRLIPQSADASTAHVVVAAMEIPFGQKVEAAHLKTVAWPRGTEPSGSFQEVAQVEGKVANQKIVANEVVIAQRVVDQVAGSTLAAIIEPRKRAVTVRVNDVVGVAGFLLPGNRVDVIAARKEGSSRRAETRTILENLKVLAVDQTASPDKDKPVVVRAVTLEMDTKQAERLFKATEEGSVQLTLRNPLDDSHAPVAEEAPKPEPKAVAVAPAPRRAAPQMDAVTVIRGTSVHVSKVKL